MITNIALAGVIVLFLAGMLFAAFRYFMRPIPAGTSPSATVLADTTHEGSRITTMLVVFHRFVLAEFNTHTLFARNSASSRAIPVKKQIAAVRNDPAMPLRWPSEERGMQGGDLLSVKATKRAQRLWYAAALIAADMATVLHKIGVHKSITNRILEPFLWHTVVVTATAWENFFDQRISPLAQKEIEVPARLMRDALYASSPIESKAHLPFVIDDDEVLAWAEETWPDSETEALDALAEISSARCARTSYLTHNGKRDISADLSLFVRLISADPKHWSPMMHVAFACPENRQEGTMNGIPIDHLPKIGAFPGWLSYRHVLERQEEVSTFR